MNEKLKQVQKQMAKKYMDTKTAFGVGIGNGVINIYVYDEDAKKRIVENEIDGIKINVEIGSPPRAS